MKKKGKLTDKQEKYVQELIKGKTQREAYKIAYPGSKRWKDSSIDEAASKLLKHAKVAPRYEELRNRVIDKAEKKAIVTAEQVLQELANVAFANGSDFAQVLEIEREEPIFDEEGNFVRNEKRYYKAVDITATKQLEESKRAAIAGIKQTQFGIEVKTYDKMKALELLGRHLKMFDNKDDDDTKTINLIHSVPRPEKDGDEE